MVCKLIVMRRKNTAKSDFKKKNSPINGKNVEVKVKFLKPLK